MCSSDLGKTMQLAARGAKVTAVEVDPARAARIRENLARTRLSADIIESDVRDVAMTAPLVLLDAPCSATGTIRRHPDVPHLKRSNDIPGLAQAQDRLLDAAAKLLKPGGRLAISDMVGLQPFPKELPKDWELYTCCITGAALKSDLEHILAHCGFRDIRVEPKPGSREVIEQWFPGRGLEAYVASATIEAVKP